MNWKKIGIALGLIILGAAAGVFLTLKLGGDGSSYAQALPGIIAAFQPYLSFGAIGLTAIFMIVGAVLVGVKSTDLSVRSYLKLAVVAILVSALVLLVPEALRAFDTDRDRICLRNIQTDFDETATALDDTNKALSAIRGSVDFASIGGHGGETPQQLAMDAMNLFKGSYDAKALSAVKKTQALQTKIESCVH
jgi:hypothetical protein